MAEAWVLIMYVQGVMFSAEFTTRKRCEAAAATILNAPVRDQTSDGTPFQHKPLRRSPHVWGCFQK